MLWGLFVNGETLSAIGYAGLAVALVAVVLVGFIPGEKVVRPTTRGLLMALGRGLAIGAFLIVIDQTSDESGLVPLVMTRVTNIAITAVIIGVSRRRALRAGATRGIRPRRVAASRSAPRRRVTPTSSTRPPGTPGTEQRRRGRCGLAAARVAARARRAVCVDAGANAIMLLALRIGDLSIVSALTALYPAGTILLAAIVLRERVAPVQWVGLALALLAGGHARAGLTQTRSAGELQPRVNSSTHETMSATTPRAIKPCRQQSDRAHERRVLREPHAVAPSPPGEDVVHLRRRRRPGAARG